MPSKKEVSASWKKALEAESREVVEKEPDYTGIQSISLRHGRMTLNDVELPGSQIQCIIVGSVIERSWYDRPYNADDKQPPTCFALGDVMSELAPHENVPAPPSATCKLCPLAEFGTALQGKGPACKTRIRLLVVPAPDNITSKDLVDPDKAFIKVSPTSVANFNGLGLGGKTPGYEKALAMKGLAVWSVVTRITNKPHPKKMAEVTFEFLKSNVADEPLMAASYAVVEASASELSAPYEYDDDDDERAANSSTASTTGGARY